MAADEKVVYCQVDAHLDSNPKIRRAGNAGRQVFEFLLRRVAIGHTQGTVPLKYIEPWYLADQLMMVGESREVTAGDGVSSAVTAQLISIDEAAGVVRIVGWSPEWGRRPKTGAERTAEYKQRNQAKPVGLVTPGDARSRQVTVGDESDVREEKRREEIQRESGKPDPDLFGGKSSGPTSQPKDHAAADLAAVAVREINRIAGKKYRADSDSVSKLCSALAKSKRTTGQVIAVIASKRTWIGDPKMGKFFRPATLLAAENFATYLDEIEAGGGTDPSSAPRHAMPRTEVVHPLARLMLDDDEEGGSDAAP